MHIFWQDLWNKIRFRYIWIIFLMGHFFMNVQQFYCSALKMIHFFYLNTVKCRLIFKILTWKTQWCNQILILISSFKKYKLFNFECSFAHNPIHALGGYVHVYRLLGQLWAGRSKKRKSNKEAVGEIPFCDRSAPDRARWLGLFPSS